MPRRLRGISLNANRTTKPLIIMKKLIFAAFAILLTSTGFGQKQTLSPKATATGTIGATKVEISYSQPSVRGRKIFGGLEAYGSVWRTGANEATTITFDKPVKIEGKDLAAGTYSLFTIPGETSWTIIFNKEAKQWGAFKYQVSQDALRVDVKASATPALVETFVISVGKDQIELKWENTQVAFKVKG